MVTKRIISFLPSATELIYELGAQNQLFGVTHECKFPKDATSKPHVIESVFEPKKMSSKQIDKRVNDLVSNGKPIYKIQEVNLKKANPDLIISQEICDVCSAATNEVNDAISILGKKPEVFVMNPHDLQGIINNVKEISKIIDKRNEGNALVKSLKSRIEFFHDKQILDKPKVLAIEWLEPFFTSGHWIPEMIELVGAENLISKKGDSSRKMTLNEIEKADPDIIILMPCGFNVKRIINEYNKILKTNHRWKNLRAVKEKNIFVVDANSYFSKPSVRTITGIEILGKIIHPEKFIEIHVPNKSFQKIN
jgi:iron complex transport system substrate-binding protein|tara:strand:+ start:350 stop:1273 length:924 start_codon:yes stop_codon:yes gene_type:complete